MRSLYSTPLDQLLADWWNSIDHDYRKAFFFVVCVNLLAFGFEMTNLTLHHDDLIQIFIQDDVLGHYLGRFGVGKLHLYTQNAYFMPFLQMLEGILLMSAYGLLVARFWGIRGTLNTLLVASILCVFPYMAQIYQYNTAMATYSLAHLLAAGAVILSIRSTFLHVATASILYMAAFSIYQGVIANAATIFLIWLLISFLLGEKGQPYISRSMIKSILAAFISVVAGGLLYMLGVSFMDLQFDSYQSAGKAFSLGDELNLSHAVTEIAKGTRSFYFWPEHYFPDYLKKLQLVFLVCAGFFCLWLPKRLSGKISASVVLFLALFAPRILQLLHPEGHYHSLTLTAYALVVASAVMIINRSGYTFVRNSSILLAFFLIVGYIIQCNWISTVNHLNTLAHYSTLTQVLARLRALPQADWAGKNIAVAGSYELPADYPFKGATGVATRFMDAAHMQKLASLMRDEAFFIAADGTTPDVLEYAATHPSWPHPASVAIMNGMGVVVFSSNK